MVVVFGGACTSDAEISDFLLTHFMRQAVWEKTDGHCCYCGVKLEITKATTRTKFVVDHFVSRKSGGSNDLSNLVPACHSCNAIKSASDIETFRRKMTWKKLGLNAPQFNPNQVDWLNGQGFDVEKPINSNLFEFHYERLGKDIFQQKSLSRNEASKTNSFPLPVKKETSSSLCHSLGERVFLLRRRRGMTQRELAKAAGLNGNTISRLEQGDIKDLLGASVAKLADVLQTTTDYLLGRVEEE